MTTSPVFLCCLIFPLVTAENFPQITKICAAEETCESEETCEWVTEKYTQIKTAASGHVKQSIIDQLKAVICNRAKKAFCCPHRRDYSAISFPTKLCAPDERCAPEESCAWARNKYREAKNAPDKETKQTVINQLKQAVCDRAKKSFCCPAEKLSHLISQRSDDSDGTYLPSPEECGGRKKEFSLYVIGGEETVPGDFPFTALLGYLESCRRNGKKEGCIKYLCGGSLINRRYVLTAAHCAKTGKRDRGVRQVLLGEWNVRTDVDCERTDIGGSCITEALPEPQKFKIRKSAVTIHPEYGAGEGRNIKINDIALIRLPKLAQINRGTQMVCLPLHESLASRHLGVPNLSSGLLNTMPTVVGWGYTTYNPWQGDYQDGFGEGNGDVASATPNKLSHGLSHNSGKECSTYSLLSSQMCGDLKRGEGACLGDSGTGLYLNGSFVDMEGGAPWYQLGIVSFGARYCDAGKPVIYTRVSSYIPWIKQNIKP